jgi:hypothetical protein
VNITSPLFAFTRIGANGAIIAEHSDPNNCIVAVRAEAAPSTHPYRPADHTRCHRAAELIRCRRSRGLSCRCTT